MDKEEVKTDMQPTETGEMMPEMDKMDTETQAEDATETTEESGELEQLRKENKELSVFQDKVRDLAETDSQAASFLHDLITTGNIGVALNENYSEEEVQALLEESKSTEYDQHRNNYATKVQAGKDRETLVSSNKATSQLSAQEFCDEMNIDPDTLDKLIAYSDKFFKDAADYNMTKEHWTTILQGMTRNDDVAEAEENGKVVGRNEQIVAKKKTREDIQGMIPGNVGAISTEKPNQSYAEQYRNSSPLGKLNLK